MSCSLSFDCPLGQQGKRNKLERHAHIRPTCFGMKYIPVIIRKKDRVSEQEEEDRARDRKREGGSEKETYTPFCSDHDV